MSEIRRHIFYIGGFDPRGIRFYRTLMRDQLARYSSLAGEEVSFTTHPSDVPHRSDWTIHNASRDATTDYTFLRWEDVVQSAWIRNPLSLAARTIRAYPGYLPFLRLNGISKGRLVAFFYPPLLSILVPLALAFATAMLLTWLLPTWVALMIGIVLGTAVSFPLLRAIHAPWLLRFFVFNSEMGRGGYPLLDRRLDMFAEEVASSLKDTNGEVLLVTHSNGSILAMPVMARLLQRFGEEMPAKFALVTYGHSIPLMGIRRDATKFHEQMSIVARSRFRWFDISSPPDGAALYGLNPLHLHTSDIRPDMELLSPRFHRFYEPENYNRGLSKKYDIHFDYLRVGDRISPLDLPTLVASGRTIREAIAAFRDIP